MYAVVNGVDERRNLLRGMRPAIFGFHGHLTEHLDKGWQASKLRQNIRRVLIAKHSGQLEAMVTQPFLHPEVAHGYVADFPQTSAA